jgi:predicted nucleic acid-binding protein
MIVSIATFPQKITDENLWEFLNKLEGVIMTNKGWLIVSLTVLLAIVTVSCSSTRTSVSGGGNSEVVVRRIDSNSSIRVRVYIDGKQAGMLRIGETAIYRVKNGEHTIFVNSDSYADKDPSVLEFTSYQSRHVFAITDGMIAPLSPTDAGAGYDLDTAVKTSFDVIAAELKNKAKVAIVNIASDNANEGHFIIEELTYLTVHSNKKFVVIDRRKIEAIRVERNFNRTSDYEDDFLISIGHLLGAEVIITGNLTGSGNLRRLRVKALNVKNGQLISMASEKV